MAIRPAQGELGTIASVESTTRVYRTTCFDGAGRIQAQVAVPRISIASKSAEYSLLLSRLLLFSPLVATATADSAADGPSRATAESSENPNRSSCTFSSAPGTGSATCGGRAAGVS